MAFQVTGRGIAVQEIFMRRLDEMIALVRDRRGVTAVEYALVAGALCAAILTSFNTFGTRGSHWMAGLTL